MGQTQSLIEHLQARGYVEQATDLGALDAAFSSGPVHFYIGFDPTAASLHVGSLLQVMVIRTLQRFGHVPVCLVGGGTARVGDPSGKSETRKMLTPERIDHNVAAISAVLARFLDFGADRANAARLVDNADWLLRLEYVAFLRDIGRHFTVNRMIAVKTYRDRLEQEQPLSFLEFNYQLLQAYDFLHLHRTYGCTLQIGGSDQWGNIIAGMELIRRCAADDDQDAPDIHCLTTPLITTASGQKMGKTERGAVWLDPDQVSPFDYYQYWYNVDDRDVGRLLRLYTELPLEAIEPLEAATGKALGHSKAVLAYEATRICHGEDAATRAREAARQAFSASDDWSAVPAVEIPEPEMKLVELVVHEAVCGFKSKREARQRITDGGVRVDGDPQTDPNTVVRPASGDKTMRLQIGKKKRLRVRFGD